MLPLDTAARSPSTMITTIDDDFRLQLLEPEARERTENLIDLIRDLSLFLSSECCLAKGFVLI